MSDFKTVLYLNNQPHESPHLKRLALFFDEIQYIAPQVYIIEERPKVDAHGGFSFEPFSDCTPWSVVHLDELQDTLPAFEDAGVAKRVLVPTFDDPMSTFNRVRKYVTQHFAEDPEFMKLSGTKTLRARARSIKAAVINGPVKGTENAFIEVALPNSVQDMLTILNTAYLAHDQSLFPIFPHARQHSELVYLLEQFRIRFPELHKMFPDLIPGENYDEKFAEITFSVACELLSAQELSRLPADKIIELRKELDQPRRRYISSDLMELSDLVKTNPWTEKTKKEIRKYVNGKLNQDIQKYHDMAREIKDKFLGSFSVAASKGGRYAAIGLMAPGIIGQFLPITLWTMIVTAACGVAVAVPDVVGALAEYIQDRRRLDRNSIAYVVNLKSRG
ncbi:MAG: hypothetical protein AB1473_20370 [Thermodesulfobacteriota bacterium]